MVDRYENIKNQYIMRIQKEENNHDYKPEKPTTTKMVTKQQMPSTSIMFSLASCMWSQHNSPDY